MHPFTPRSVFRQVNNPGLFDHIKAGDSIDDFLDGFGTVKREHMIALLELCRADTLTAAT